MEGSGGSILCGSIGSKSKLVRLQACWDVVLGCAREPVSQSTSLEWIATGYQLFRLDTADLLGTGVTLEASEYSLL